MPKCVKSEKVSRGQTVVTSYGRDDSNYSAGDGKMGGVKMGGSTTNLAHSLSGSSAHMDGTGHNKKNKFS